MLRTLDAGNDSLLTIAGFSQCRGSNPVWGQREQNVGTCVQQQGFWQGVRKHGEMSYGATMIAVWSMDDSPQPVGDSLSLRPSKGRFYAE